jgi:secondary thiamine-phosphate synthase enzyme
MSSSGARGEDVTSTTIEVQVQAPHKESFVDITEDLVRAVKDSGVTEGCAVVFCRHTTCALIINEAEDGALDDLRVRLSALVPTEVSYGHDDFERRTQNMHADERRNGRAHVAQMIVGGTSHAIPISGGEPLLGTWQRLFLLELDDPKQRKIVSHIFGH